MKLLKILAALLLIAGIGGFFVYKYINKTMDDIADKAPVISYTLSEWIEKSSDTASLYQHKDKVVAVQGNVKNLIKEANHITIEIGDSTSVSSVICQIDDRYTADFAQVQTNTPIKIKGLLRGVEMDDSGLGLGNTVQLNYCVKN